MHILCRRSEMKCSSRLLCGLLMSCLCFRGKCHNKLLPEWKTSTDASGYCSVLVQNKVNQLFVELWDDAAGSFELCNEHLWNVVHKTWLACSVWKCIIYCCIEKRTFFCYMPIWHKITFLFLYIYDVDF